MQRDFSDAAHILDEKGYLINSGWARDDFFIFDRSRVKSSPLRIKSWDYWEVFNNDERVIFNIFDIGYMGVAQFSFLNFSNGKTVDEMLFRPFPLGRLKHPPRWRYDAPLTFQKGNNIMEFRRNSDNIILKANFPEKNISAEINLYNDPQMDSVVNVIPFKNPRHFVYAIKVLCMPANGRVDIGEKSYLFSNTNNSWGLLDWTRAVFPYRNHWKWCTASGKVGGKNFGFNIDYGFGTESDKSMIINDGKGHHLNEVEYQQDWKYLKKPLEIKSKDGRVDLLLNPVYGHEESISLKVMEMRGIKSYGCFTGKMILDDGSVINIKNEDRLFGWAEEFFQKW